MPSKRPAEDNDSPPTKKPRLILFSRFLPIDLFHSIHALCDHPTRRKLEEALEWPYTAVKLPPPSIDLFLVKCNHLCYSLPRSRRSVEASPRIVMKLSHGVVYGLSLSSFPVLPWEKTDDGSWQIGEVRFEERIPMERSFLGKKGTGIRTLHDTNVYIKPLNMNAWRNASVPGFIHETIYTYWMHPVDGEDFEMEDKSAEYHVPLYPLDWPNTYALHRCNRQRRRSTVPSPQLANTNVAI